MSAKSLFASNGLMTTRFSTWSSESGTDTTYCTDLRNGSEMKATPAASEDFLAIFTKSAVTRRLIGRLLRSNSFAALVFSKVRNTGTKTEGSRRISPVMISPLTSGLTLCASACNLGSRWACLSCWLWMFSLRWVASEVSNTKSSCLTYLLFCVYLHIIVSSHAMRLQSRDDFHRILLCGIPRNHFRAICRPRPVPGLEIYLRPQGFVGFVPWWPLHRGTNICGFHSVCLT